MPLIQVLELKQPVVFRVHILQAEEQPPEIMGLTVTQLNVEEEVVVEHMEVMLVMVVQ
jgi:hypothetical protein